MRLGASRFVAGETAEEFIGAARRANSDGFAIAAGILGEDTQDRQAAVAAAASYIDLLQRIDRNAIDSTLSLKVTHLGLNVDKQLTFENVASVATTARALNNFVRLDMEQSRHVDDTLAIYRRLRSEDFENVGFVLQSYLYRSLDDLASLLPLGTNVRIVKGAYLEPASVAYQNKSDVDVNYMRLLARSLRSGTFTAVATHDPTIIEAVLHLIDDHKIPHDRLEFQMLYGISTRLAATLRARGHRVRLATPFGSYWFPYLMRRLAERPANLGFFLRNALVRS
jgi:proline dehydrogenase